MMRLALSAAVPLLFALSAASSAQLPAKDPPIPIPGPPIGVGTGIYGLAIQKSVQDEIKLSDEQKKKIQDLQDKLAEVQKETATDPKAIEKVIKTMTENEKALKELLNKDQLKRVNEIRLQQQGGWALMTPEVQNELKLTPEQLKEIADIVQRMTKDMLDLLRPKPGTEPADVRKKTEQLYKETAEKLLKVLTEEQQKQWKEMQGEPFKGKLETPALPIVPGGGIKPTPVP